MIQGALVQWSGSDIIAAMGIPANEAKLTAEINAAGAKICQLEEEVAVLRGQLRQANPFYGVLAPPMDPADAAAVRAIGERLRVAAGNISRK